MRALLALVLAVVGVAAAGIFPLPVSYVEGNGELAVSACNLRLEAYELPFDAEYYYNKMVKREFASDGIGCVANEVIPIIVIVDPLYKKEQYGINVQEKRIVLTLAHYNGYVYALETLFQLIDNGRLKSCKLNDEPIVEHRGIMLDSVRHFLSLTAIKRTIEAMPVSKLNKLHWHLADDEAFPLETLSHPQLSLEGAYDKKSRYSISDIKEVIAFAKANAVMVIPEIDTPGHVRAWGLSKQWKAQNITIKCPGGQGYNHQFDLSKDAVYNLVVDVLKEIDVLFRDSDFIHLGGDEVFASCWDQVPAIKTFMKAHNIGSYGELVMYWRKEIRKAFADNRKVGFWKNTGDNVTTGPDDVLHYWGNQNLTADFVKSSQSKIVLSPSDYLYLDSGVGFITGNPHGHFSTWRQIYQNFTAFPAGVDPARILGAEALLWGELANEDNLDTGLWMRASAFAERVWTNQKTPIADIVTRLVAISKQLNKLGVATSPLVSEYCEWYPHQCFK